MWTQSPLLQMPSLCIDNCAFRTKMADFSTLEKAMQTLVFVFHEYASKDKDAKGKELSKEPVDEFKLNKGELKELLHKELPHFMGDVRDAHKLNQMMSDLDEDKDGQVDFQEFVVFIASLSCVCNEIIECLMSGEETPHK